MIKINWARLAFAVIVCNVAGLAGSVFTAPNIPTWYASLNKPAFNPPNWIFGPVWTTLFVLMGISLYIVWMKTDFKGDGCLAKAVFGIQLDLNILWSILFFGMQNPLLAFIEIIALWLSIFSTIWIFYRIDRKASYMLIPYIAWVSFAAFLNYSIWMLN